MRKFVLILLVFLIYSSLFSQNIYTEDRKLFVDDIEYRINGICYARGEGNGENSGFSYLDDIPLLVEANINTIRTYSAITNVAELNAFHAAGIKIIMSLNENSYTWYVNQFKNHPAILMWEFGNEFNYHPYWFDDNIQNWYNQLEECAATVKSLDPNHPVSTAHGEVPSLQALNSCPSIDVWGMNVYRWTDSASAIDDLAVLTDKAIYISEAGADSFDSNNGSENQQLQAAATQVILNSILEKSDLSIGVTLFEFCDEWWKAGNPNQQDAGGFPNSIPYDSFANEEYWGIVTRERVPKQAFYTVKDIYEEVSLGFSNNLNEENTVTIYPNPVIDILHIDTSFQFDFINITNIFGQTVYKNKRNITQINVSNFASGLYILKIIDKNGSEIKQKFIIK